MVTVIYNTITIQICYSNLTKAKCMAVVHMFSNFGGKAVKGILGGKMKVEMLKIKALDQGFPIRGQNN